MDRIIYKNDDNSISIIIPAPEALQSHSIMEIAIKDVPAGKPFKIVSLEDIPSDREFRSAWTIEDSELTDGIGGESNEFN